MARHDREESLEEQLAWLDAIKDTEETPVSVSASTASADEPVSSPYPKDPWRLVPTQHETPTPPLFRAAVDSVYGPEAAEDFPEAESEAAEWLDTAATREEPKSPPPSTGADDPFHAPLKPLPRPDDTDSYALSFTPPAEADTSEQTQEEDSSWPSSDWTRPVKEPSSDWSRPAEEPSSDWSRPAEEPPAAQEPARAEDPAPAEEETEAWADTLPRNERPKWAEPLPKEEPAQSRQRAEPAERRPEPPQKPERPQWTEHQEWRPAERDIPTSPPPRPRRRPAPVPVFAAPPRPPVTGRPTADSLDPESLLRGRRNAPSKGWRRLVYKASGGWIKPGEPPEVRRRRELIARARTPVTTGHHRVAVLSLKGGVGKTTTTVGLGATLAQMRGDRVIAVDANPDRGTLSDKLVLETSATVRDLLNERDQVKRYVDIRAFTSQAPSRLEVLASDRDPSVSEAFSGADYQAVSQVLENFYSICITDCGTGLLHSAMGGVLGLADQIVLVSSPSVDGARAASATLDWLEAHHYADLVKNATVVLCSVRPRSKSAVDIKKLEAHFAARCRAVIRVPYDPHLEEGAEIDLDRLQESTRDAYLQLAACVGDGFAVRD
ncbi:MinD/ParA family ATP-binding protein [Nonomuraea sp. SYSU D8015]|uniref:MinD/ParA family ATP-binding protein n=1 Tax=Nonomuraea sp. SYSU D8015 TaxID=2593644 RepID=UPI001CB6CBAE|nr:MinD/ParA family protein [Nonomuraea sp. SYSU D8015]